MPPEWVRYQELKLSNTTSLALMITAMIRYSVTTVAYVADYGTSCRVDMGNMGQRRRASWWSTFSGFSLKALIKLTPLLALPPLARATLNTAPSAGVSLSASSRPCIRPSRCAASTVGSVSASVNTRAVKKVSAAASSGGWCFHPLGASEDSTLSTARVAARDQASTHDNHCALISGYSGRLCY